MSLSLNPQGFPVWQGEPLDLPPKERAVLALLIRRSPQVVSKDEFALHAWGGAAISDESLTRCISRLRRVHPDLRIDSLYGVGYRLVQPTPEIHRRLLAAAQAPQPVVEAYLHAHAMAERRTPAALQRALELLRTLAAEHPHYVPARVALASTLGHLASWGVVGGEAWFSEGMVQVDAAAQLAPADPAVLTCRAWLHDLAWRHAEADALYTQALAGPAAADAETLALHGWHRLVYGDPAGAVERLREAAALQPYAVHPRVLLARALYHAGDAAAALAETEAVLRDHPDSPVASGYRLALHAAADAPSPELAAEARALLAQRETSPANIGVAAYALARGGETAEARRLVDDSLAAAGASSPCTGLLHTAALLVLGERERAAEQIVRGHAARCGVLPMVLRTPVHAELMDEPRVAAIRRAVFGDARP